MNSFAAASLLLTLTALAGCVQSKDSNAAGPNLLEETVGLTEQPLTPAGGDQCPTVDAAAIHAVLDEIEAAQASTALTLADHPNEPHTYIVENLGVDLSSAHSEVQDAYDWIQGPASDGDPNVTNYVEGEWVLSWMYWASPGLQDARWNAMTASIYLDDTNAYAAFEHVSLAIELSNDLATRGGRCFMAAYGIP